MKTKYFVCGLGYDSRENITEYDQDFGCFDTYAEAYEFFVKLQCVDASLLFVNVPELRQMCIQIEECEDTEDAISCTDVRNEWWVVNPNFEEQITFTAYVRDVYNGICFIADRSTYDSQEEAIAFAKDRNWDGVMDDVTGEIVWVR